MNFSSHQTKLIESISIALGKKSFNLINDFKLIHSTAKKLYRTEVFDFWLSEIGQHPTEEIPITKYGYSLALNSLKRLESASRNSVPGLIFSICESLFTYSNDKEMCLMQSDYHYYYSIEEKCIFKESELGCIEGLDSKNQIGTYRIAFKSELNILDNEYY